MRARRQRPLQYLLEPRPRLSDGRTPIPMPVRMQGRLPLLTSNRSSPQREPRLSIVCARGCSSNSLSTLRACAPGPSCPALDRREGRDPPTAAVLGFAARRRARQARPTPANTPRPGGRQHAAPSRRGRPPPSGGVSRRLGETPKRTHGSVALLRSMGIGSPRGGLQGANVC
jgi:hypothetical protein